MLVLGVDPGAQGALCLLDTFDGSCEYFSTPKTKWLTATTRALHQWLAISESIAYIAIEDVHSMGGMSAKSNFQFGRNLGFLEAIMHLSCNIIEYVQPKIWQEAVGIKFPRGLKPKEKKIFTSKRVLELYPEASIYGPKGGLLDGRADALMIAHYLELKYGGQHGTQRTNTTTSSP